MCRTVEADKGGAYVGEPEMKVLLGWSCAEGHAASEAAKQTLFSLEYVLECSFSRHQRWKQGDGNSVKAYPIELPMTCTAMMSAKLSNQPSTHTLRMVENAAK